MELFSDYLVAPGSCSALTVSAKPLDAACRNAIGKSLESFGYGADACAYATLQPRDPDAEGGDVLLDAQALFLLVESVDPLLIVCCDGASAQCLGEAYRTAFDLDSPARIFGRSAVVFRDLGAMLESDAGKQRAWRLLKTLPKR